jgi:hypothetical protein
VGSERELTERFMALCSHYLFEACFTRPGEGHDKGGVEARGKGIRLAHLTPIPRGTTLSEISEVLLREIELAFSDEQRFAQERRCLRPLPEQSFEARRVKLVSVSRSSTVRIDGASYSVPSGWASLRATAYVGVEDIRIHCCGQSETYLKERKGGQKIRYRHYLSELARKPQAVRQVAPELIDELGPPYSSGCGRCSPRATGVRRPHGSSRASSEPPSNMARRRSLGRGYPLLPCPRPFAATRWKQPGRKTTTGCSKLQTTNHEEDWAFSERAAHEGRSADGPSEARQPGRR